MLPWKLFVQVQTKGPRSQPVSAPKLEWKVQPSMIHRVIQKILKLSKLHYLVTRLLMNMYGRMSPFSIFIPTDHPYLAENTVKRSHIWI